MITRGGLYVHIPFCESKCRYCSFFSKISSEEMREKFVEELCNEIRSTAQNVSDFRVQTVYFGGGTPSILTEKQLEKIIAMIFSCYQRESPEITIEVNPSSGNKFSFYQQIGINRVSVGVQSTSDRILQKLGRKHTATQSLNTLENARNFFDNISADLIIGVENDQDPISDFDRIKGMIRHLSSYILTVEEKTPLSYLIQKGDLTIADEDSCVKQYSSLVEHCKNNGFIQYETSNFCQDGYTSKHNSSYWNLTSYLGFGPGAHSYYNGVRYYNPSDLTAYIKGVHAGNHKQTVEREANVSEDKREYVMLALRTTKGIDLSFYNKIFNSDFYMDFGEQIKKAEDFLCRTDRYVSILPQFFLVQNSIIESIIFE